MASLAGYMRSSPSDTRLRSGTASIEMARAHV
jgi:hypothetical protein